MPEAVRLQRVTARKISAAARARLPKAPAGLNAYAATRVNPAPASSAGCTRSPLKGMGPAQEKIEIDAEFEVGRPPGLAPGTPIDAVLTMPFGNIPLDAGRYEWRLLVDGDVLGGVTFTVKQPPSAAS